MANARSIQHPKLKKYVALVDIKPTGIKGNWKKGQLIRVDPDKVRPYISGRQIMPLDVAIRQDLYDPTPKTLTDKITTAVTGTAKPASPKTTDTKPTTPSDKPAKKILGNKLRDAVQQKKSPPATEPSPKTIDQNKLAAIKSGGAK